MEELSIHVTDVFDCETIVDLSVAEVALHIILQSVNGSFTHNLHTSAVLCDSYTERLQVVYGDN